MARSLLFGLIILLGIVPARGAEKDDPDGLRLADKHGCVTCHGETGISTGAEIPNLARQRLKYLRKQINSFASRTAKRYQAEKISERHHPAMARILRTVPRQDIDRILRYYANRRCNYTPASRSLMIPEQARKCEVCHGGVRSSPFADTPILNGQKEDYIVDQLLAMKAAIENPNMPQQRYHRMAILMVEGLEEEDIRIAAKYYAQLPCR